MKTTLRHAAGSLLVVGLGGTELSGLERAWLKLVRPAGVILFRRNIADARQTRALLDEATALCAPNSFRCVDVEGGTVDRLRDALAPMPSAQAVAEAARRTGKSRLIREQGELIAQGVKAFGFNTTLAPVLDLATPESAEVMGTRAAAADAAGVVEYARDFLAGLAKHRRCGLRQALSRPRRRHARFASGNSGNSSRHARTVARRSCFPIANCAMSCR